MDPHKTDALGRTAVDEKVEALEEQLERLLAESASPVDVEEISVAPRSKLRVACE